VKTQHGYASPLPTNAAASYPEVSLSAEASFLAQQLQLPLNRHGNVDIRKGLPPGVCFLPETASAAELRLAGIPVARALTGFGLEGRKYFPLWADAEVVPVGWDQQFKRWQETAEGAEILRRHREQLQKAADAKTAKRREAAQRAAATREEKRQLMASPLGQLMLILREAQKASDRAKRRAANGCRRSDYYERDNSAYAAANYRRSRKARTRDYEVKEGALRRAVALAPLCGVLFGWGVDEGGNDVLYFELQTGQVSFHCTARFSGPDYTGSWDGVRGVSGQRIEAAIRAHLAKTTTLNS
jgi:hypothetical protein